MPRISFISAIRKSSSLVKAPFLIHLSTSLINPSLNSSPHQYTPGSENVVFPIPVSNLCVLHFPSSTRYCSTCPSSTGTQELTQNVDSEQIYNVIVENCNADKSMESALEVLDVRLTAELVGDILSKLWYEEKIAFRFFTWAGKQEGYMHESKTYDEMIDILSSTKYKVKQFRIVCDLLEYMKRKGRNSVPVEILIDILRKYTEKYLSRVQKCRKKKKVRVRTQPEINAFNLLLDSLCKCCLVEEAETLFTRLKKKVTPNGTTYNILFFGWCRVRNPSRGMKVLEEMIDMGHKPENFTYTTAIDAYCRAGLLSEAAALFDFMRTKGSTMSSPTAKTYAIMIVAFANCDRMDECLKLIMDMIACGCLPNVSTYKEVIEGLCLAGKFEEAYNFLEEMGNKGYPADIVTYNCFLKVLCDLKNAEETLKLYGRMTEVGCIPSVHTFNMMIAMFFEMGQPDGAFEAWDEMEIRGCKPDIDTYCVMIEGLFGCGKTEDACFLLENVVNKGMQLPYRKFDSLLMKLSETGDLQGIHRLSEYMRGFYNPSMARRFAASQKRMSTSLRRK